MGTRSNIVIEVGSSRVYLYRHWDGYLAGAGRDIYSKLVAAGSNADQFLRSLMAEMDEATSYRPAKGVYELTSEVHGDIEYLYFVRFSDRGSREPEIGWATFRPGDDRSPSIKAVGALGSAEAFKGAVNRAIVEQNARLAQLKREQPGAYGDVEPDAVLS